MLGEEDWSGYVLLSMRGVPCVCSLQSVHDDEKPFEMELSWICPESDNEFRRVPAELATEAERSAKAALADSDMCASKFYRKIDQYS